MSTRAKNERRRTKAIAEYRKTIGSYALHVIDKINSMSNTELMCYLKSTQSNSDFETIARISRKALKA
jgi:hypothetical protein